jgi:hypothetical protein
VFLNFQENLWVKKRKFNSIPNTFYGSLFLDLVLAIHVRKWPPRYQNYALGWAFVAVFLIRFMCIAFTALSLAVLFGVKRLFIHFNFCCC